MKKEYTRPAIVKVELNHEQAILGVCSASSNAPKGGTPPTACLVGGCKAYNRGTSRDQDSGASS
jgi:hypothetical protein